MAATGSTNTSMANEEAAEMATMSKHRWWIGPCGASCLDGIIGKRIFFFWISKDEDAGNHWYRAEVLQQHQRDPKSYYVRFHEGPAAGKRLIIDLVSESAQALWSRNSERPTPNPHPASTPQGASGATQRKGFSTWVQCTRQGCSRWTLLPDQLHRYYEKFTCDQAVWLKKAKRPVCTGVDGAVLPRRGAMAKQTPVASDSHTALPDMPAPPSAYEQLRQKNVARNRDFLQSIGLEQLPRATCDPRTTGSASKASTPTTATANARAASKSITGKRAPTSTNEAAASRRSSRKRRKRVFFDEAHSVHEKANKVFRKHMRRALDESMGNTQEVADDSLMVIAPVASTPIVKDSTIAVRWTSKHPAKMIGGYICLVREYSRLEDVYWIETSLSVEDAMAQQIMCQIPIFVEAGPGFAFEVGCERTGIVARSEQVTLSDPIGITNESDTGVWCCCGDTSYKLTKNYQGEWLSCSACKAWQHKGCYRQSETCRLATFRCKSCAETSRESWVAKSEEWKALPSPSAAEGCEICGSDVDHEKTLICDGCDGEFHMYCLHPPLKRIPRGLWLCPKCLPHSSSIRRRAAHARIIGQMVKMIGGHTQYRRQRVSEEKLCSTPAKVARFLGDLVDAGEKVVELGAGEGAISYWLPEGTVCLEILEHRVKRGKEAAPHVEWHQADCLSPAFLRWMLVQGVAHSFDVVVSNPAFELGLCFLYVALQLLSFSEQAHIIFLLPSDFFEGSAARTRVYKLLQLRVVTEYKLGHLGFYEDKRSAEKKSCDSLFVLERKRLKKYEWTTINARLAGMLRVERLDKRRRHRRRTAADSQWWQPQAQLAQQQTGMSSEAEHTKHTGGASSNRAYPTTVAPAPAPAPAPEPTAEPAFPDAAT